MDVVDLRRRQAEIESRIYRTQDRLRTELLRLRGKVDTRRQSVRDARRTSVQVLIGAGVGIVLSLVTTVFRNAFRTRRHRAFERDVRHELEDREGYGHGEQKGWFGQRIRTEERLRGAPRHATETRAEVPYPRREETRDRYSQEARYDQEARYGREEHYLGGHREPIPPGYGRRLPSEEDHEWAQLPLGRRRTRT